MINYEQLEDATLFGLEESLDVDLARNEFGYIKDENGYERYQGSEIAEALYAKFMGWF